MKFNFLHDHPMTEKSMGLDDKHKIVDIEDWEYARSQVFNLGIPDVSKMLPMAEKHAIRLLRENWCNEDEEDLTDEQVLEKFPDEYALACQLVKDVIGNFC